MRSPWRFAICLVLISTVALPAEPQGSHTHRDNATATPDWAELMASMVKMHNTMASIEQSGDNDGDFIRLMLPHHQAAIDMAKTQLMYGKDPQMRRLAQEIIADQQSEIDLMQLWQKQHAAPSANQTPALQAGKEH